MADQQDFEKLSTELMAIDEKDIQEPDMPVDEAVKENEIMSAAAKQSQNAFTPHGIAGPAWAAIFPVRPGSGVVFTSVIRGHGQLLVKEIL
jgi:hypothetical protein